MACDMVVALGPATVGNTTLVGINHHGVAERKPQLRRYAARHCPPDETILLTHLQLPQARETSTVLGSQPADLWGFTHGLNEHRVVMGCAGWRSRISHEEPGLLGPELVRLVLERCHSAQHGVEVLTDLIVRYGQCASGSEAGATDQLFLLADGREAYVLEAAGRFWAVQECHQARAISDVALIRQDWCRLAPGLAEHAERNRWWDDDGNKFDFAGRLEEMTAGQPFALKRWGRATLLLEQQNGHLDLASIRRLLIEHYEDTIVRRRPRLSQPAPPLQTTFAVQLPTRETEPVIAWIGIGPTCNELFFPVVLDGELPDKLEHGASAVGIMPHRAWMTEAQNKTWQEDLARQQFHLESQAEAFASEYAGLKRQGNTVMLARLATNFMQAQALYLEHSDPSEIARSSHGLHQSDLAFIAE